MADSDNSRTLPAVTLQEFHSLVSACVPDFSRPTILGADQPSDFIDEPVIAIPESALSSPLLQAAPSWVFRRKVFKRSTDQCTW